MLKAKERWIIHYDAQFEAVRDGPKVIPVEELLRYLRTRSTDGSAVSAGDGDIRIKRIEITPRWATILVANFDSRGADPAYGLADTGNIRRLKREPGESNAYSAHIVLKLEPESLVSKEGYPKYRFAIEDVPGLGKTRLLTYFNRVLRDFKRSYSDRQGVESTYYAKLTLWPHCEERVSGQILKNGLQHFEVIKEKLVKGGFDQEGFTTIVSERVKLKPTQAGERSPIKMMKAVAARAAGGGYTRMKIVYKGPDGNQLSEKFNPARQDLEDIFQSKYEKVDLRAPLTQCEESISRELVFKIRSQIR